MLLEIDAQGSEGLAVLTKLRAEGTGGVRKMRAGSNEDQVEEHWREGAEDWALKKRTPPSPSKKEGMALATSLKGNCFIHSL